MQPIVEKIPPPRIKEIISKYLLSIFKPTLYTATCLSLFMACMLYFFPHAVVGNTNSVITQAENQPNLPATTTLLFFGDAMFDRGVRAQIKKIGSATVYEKFTKELSDIYDFTIANLEGPITSYKSKTIGADGKGIPGFTFTFPTTTATSLKNSGIDIVSLANNHSDNFGSLGLKQTMQYLSSSSVLFFGNPTNTLTETNTSPATTTHSSIYSSSTSYRTAPTRDLTTPPISTTVCKEKCISFIGFHEFTKTTENIIEKEIVRLRKTSDLIIVLPHWGVEYDHLPSTKQKRLARLWIDAGADAVIGSHPHVIQPLELYKGKPIFYSLGNFLFDQYFSYHTTHGLAVGLTYSDSSLKSIRLIPIDNTKILTRQTMPVDTEIMLKKLFNISNGFVPKGIQDQILKGEIIF